MIEKKKQPMLATSAKAETPAAPIEAPPVNQAYVDNELGAALEPAPPSRVLPDEPFNDWYSRVQKSNAPQFEQGDPNETVYQNQVGEFRKQMGKGMGMMQGSANDPGALFDNTVRNLKGYTNENHDAAVFNAFNDVLNKRPEAKAAFEAQTETERMAQQRNLSAELQESRNEQTPEGQALFDALLDKRRQNEAFPEFAEPSPAEVLNAAQNKMSGAGDQVAPQDQPAYNPIDDLPPAEQQQMKVDQAKRGIAQRMSEKAATPMYQKKAFTDGLQGGLKGAEQRIADGTASMDDYLATGRRRSRYGDYGKKTEMVEDGRDKKGEMQYRKRERDMTADEWVDQQNKKTSLPPDYMNYVEDLIGMGVDPDTAAKTGMDFYEQSQKLEDQGFQTAVVTMPDGTRMIKYRASDSSGWMLKNFKTDAEPGIYKNAGGWYEVQGNGDVLQYEKTDGVMGSDGQFYGFQYVKDEEGKEVARTDELGNYVPNFPVGVSVWTDGAKGNAAGKAAYDAATGKKGSTTAASGQKKPKGGKSKPLDEATAQEFFDQAGGDAEKARELAKKAGYTF